MQRYKRRLIQATYITLNVKFLNFLLKNIKKEQKADKKGRVSKGSLAWANGSKLACKNKSISWALQQWVQGVNKNMEEGSLTFVELQTEIRIECDSDSESNADEDLTDYCPHLSFQRVLKESSRSQLWLATHDAREIVVKLMWVEANRGSQRMHQQNEIQFIQKYGQMFKIEQLILKKKLMISIIEYFPQGDLSSRLYCSMDQLKLYLKKIIEAVQRIHCLRYIHRDIKPENILISNSEILITDFEFVIAEGGYDSSLCGTIEYIAPERLIASRTQKPVTYATDVWSIGIIAFQLCMGQPPFKGSNEEEMWDSICSGINYEGVPDQLAQFVRFVLVLVQKQRPTLKQLLDHKFLSST